MGSESGGNKVSGHSWGATSMGTTANSGGPPQEVVKERSNLVDQVHHTAIRATDLHSAISDEL